MRNSPSSKRFSNSQPGHLVGVGLLVILALVGVQSIYTTFASGSDLTPTTMLALLLQTAVLSLALGLPFHFGDLDLSVGPVTMLGVLLVVPVDRGSSTNLL